MLLHRHVVGEPDGAVVLDDASDEGLGARQRVACEEVLAVEDNARAPDLEEAGVAAGPRVRRMDDGRQRRLHNHQLALAGVLHELGQQLVHR